MTIQAAETTVSAPRAVSTTGEEGGAKVPGPGTLMSLFIVDLVLHQEKLEFFLKNPDHRKTIMGEAGLTEDEQALLTTPCFVHLCDRLEKAGVGPVPCGDDGGAG